MAMRLLMAGLCCLSVVGCVEEKPKQGIINKTTQDIGKADASDKRNASDSKVRVSDPVTAPLQAYGPIMEQISKMGIEHAIDLFHATEGRYPKDYDEFMTRIIKENNMRLPVLPDGAKYKYDEAAHKLIVVPAPKGPGT